MANASGLPRIVFVAPPAGPALLLPSWLDCNSNDRGGDGGLHEHDPARLASLLHIEPELQRGSREAEEGAEERPRTWPPPGPVSLGARPQGPAAHGSVSHNGALTYAAGKPQHQPPQAMCSSGSAEGNESPRSSGPPPPAPQPCPRIPSPPVARASRGNVAVSASTAPRPSVAVSVAGAAAQGPAEAPVGGQSLAAKQLTEGKLGRHPTAMTPAKSTPAARAVKVVRHQPSGNAAKESIEITQPNKETPEAATRSKPQQVQDRSPLAAKVCWSELHDGHTPFHPEPILLCIATAPKARITHCFLHDPVAG